MRDGVTQGDLCRSEFHKSDKHRSQNNIKHQKNIYNVKCVTNFSSHLPERKYRAWVWTS
jgi:hypothetical protein